jgi:hypothetical protein
MNERDELSSNFNRFLENEFRFNFIVNISRGRTDYSVIYLSDSTKIEYKRLKMIASPKTQLSVLLRRRACNYIFQLVNWHEHAYI